MAQKRSKGGKKGSSKKTQRPLPSPEQIRAGIAQIAKSRRDARRRSEAAREGWETRRRNERARREAEEERRKTRGLSPAARRVRATVERWRAKGIVISAEQAEGKPREGEVPLSVLRDLQRAVARPKAGVRTAKQRELRLNVLRRAMLSGAVTSEEDLIEVASWVGVSQHEAIGLWRSPDSPR